MKTLFHRATWTWLALILTIPAGAQVPAQWTSGHGDIGVAYEEEGPGFVLHPHWHLEGGVVNGTSRPDEEFAAGDLELVVPDNASTQAIRQSGAQWNPIGVGEGAAFWRLPQSSVAGVPFAGWATEELEESDWMGPITFRLSALDGPGDISLYHFPDGNLTFLWASSNGVTAADAFNLDPGVHTHFNVAFTERGTYAVALTVSGEHMTAGFQSATETFTFRVVPEPGSALLAAAGLGIWAGRRRRVA